MRIVHIFILATIGISPLWGAESTKEQDYEIFSADGYDGNIDSANDPSIFNERDLIPFNPPFISPKSVDISEPSLLSEICKSVFDYCFRDEDKAVETPQDATNFSNWLSTATPSFRPLGAPQPQVFTEEEKEYFEDLLDDSKYGPWQYTPHSTSNYRPFRERLEPFKNPHYNKTTDKRS